MSDTLTIDQIPAEFRKMRMAGQVGMIAHNGPLYGRLDEDGLTMGILIDERHLNPRGICHGGMLMTLADMVLGVGSIAHTKEWEFVPTVNMTCDFVKAVPQGAWLTGKATVIRKTKSMLFSSCLIMHGEDIVMRSSGIMKRTGNFRDADLERMFEPEGS